MVSGETSEGSVDLVLYSYRRPFILGAEEWVFPRQGPERSRGSVRLFLCRVSRTTRMDQEERREDAEFAPLDQCIGGHLWKPCGVPGTGRQQPQAFQRGVHGRRDPAAQRRARRMPVDSLQHVDQVDVGVDAPQLAGHEQALDRPDAAGAETGTSNAPVPHSSGYAPGRLTATALACAGCPSCAQRLPDPHRSVGARCREHPRRPLTRRRRPACGSCRPAWT